jgi:hypothetical protein
MRLRDLQNDTPMSLPDAAVYLGKLTGRKPHVSTLWRWCLKGCKGVKLDSICIGNKRLVTAAAIELFVESLSTAREVHPGSQPPDQAHPTVARSHLEHVVRHNDRRKEEIEAARCRLDQLTGVKQLPPGAIAPADATRSA